jgi:hypothetical protein
MPECLCGLEVARKWGLIVSEGGVNESTGQYPSSAGHINGVSGVPIPTRFVFF